MKKILGCILIVASLVGCVNMGQLKSIDSSQAINPELGYAYGRFNLERYGYQLLEVWLSILKDGEEKSSIIKFKTKGDVLAVELTPGKYSIDKFVIAKGGFAPISMSLKSEIREIPIRDELKVLMKPFEVRSLTGVYLGDFYGVTGKVPSKDIFTETYVGGVTRVLNKFDDTTQAAKTKFPEMSVLNLKAAPYIEQLPTN